MVHISYKQCARPNHKSKRNKNETNKTNTIYIKRKKKPSNLRRWLVLHLCCNVEQWRQGKRAAQFTYCDPKKIESLISIFEKEQRLNFADFFLTAFLKHEKRLIKQQ